MSQYTLKIPGRVNLESGAYLIDPVIVYHSFGEYNLDKNNVVWVCHALTANSDPTEWWPGLIGQGHYINPDDHFIICANVLGSPYGSTYPLSNNPESGEAYYYDFPEITIRDMVAMHIALADHLKIKKIQLLIGGSMGGHQVLEWSIIQPGRMDHIAVLASSAIHSPWGVAFNESQRMAIAADQKHTNDEPSSGVEGLKAARSIAMLSYRNYATYHATQQASSQELLFPDRATSYQQYQGQKLANRFDAYSYWYLSRAMDSQNVGRGRDGIISALRQIQAKSLIITLQDDMLFPLDDQLTLARYIPYAEHRFIPSIYGHDGFLIETERISAALESFLDHPEGKSLHSTEALTGIESDIAPSKKNKIKLGMIGLGTVGSAVYQQLIHRDDISVEQVVVKHIEPDHPIQPECISTDIHDILGRDDLDLIIEVIDDADAAYGYVKALLKKGLTIITANKKMLACYLTELRQFEQLFGGQIIYEAAVAGAIPVIRTIKEYYQTEPIQSMSGILNGSTNYILTKMSKSGWSYDQALEQAQALGFAESNPSLDVDGYDAAYKAIILAEAAFGKILTINDVSLDGITKVTTEDIQAAAAQGKRIKLIADIVRSTEGQISIKVAPRSVSPDDMLYHVDNELNAIAIHGRYSGINTLIGKGAGGDPTASAIVADVDWAIRQVNQTKTVLPK